MSHHLKHKRYFVTATGTSVGKTIVSRALLQALNKNGYSSNGYKPLAINHDEQDNDDKDALILQDGSATILPEKEINPIKLAYEQIWRAEQPEFDMKVFSDGLAKIEKKSDVVIVEGTGGWRVLFNGQLRLSDWVIKENLPVILVVGIQPGCINHALLSAEAIRQDGLTLAGWVANRINPGESFYAETIETLGRQLAAPQLGELPYLAKPDARDLSQYINIQPLCQN
jgi:dethiobiotin synthetase